MESPARFFWKRILRRKSKNDIYDLLTERILRQTLKPDSNAVDIGCHAGAILDLILEAAPRGVDLPVGAGKQPRGLISAFRYGQFAPGKARIVIISVDGERDTPAAMAEWLKPISKNFLGLTGSPAKVREIAREFSAAFYKTPGKTPNEYLV